MLMKGELLSLKRHMRGDREGQTLFATSPPLFFLSEVSSPRKCFLPPLPLCYFTLSIIALSNIYQPSIFFPTPFLLVRVINAKLCFDYLFMAQLIGSSTLYRCRKIVIEIRKFDFIPYNIEN